MSNELPFARPLIGDDERAAVDAVLRSGWLTTGPRCREFEDALSAYFGGRPTRVVASGTAALEIALRLAGIGPGDEVITCPLSWVATANVVLAVGATPVFVDADARTRNIDVSRIEPAIGARTRMLLPVDLAGLPTDRDALAAIASRHHLRVLEDAAQSMGANWHGARIGSFGDLVSFSFHANKNMTTGEGGCLVMNDAEEARRFEKLRLQGVTRFPDGSMDVDVLGAKANLTDIAAALGIVQLRRLDEFNERRRALARLYFEHFDCSLGFELPPADFEQSNWHMFQPLLPLDRLRIGRGEFIDAMRREGIAVGVHYPAMHLFALYRARGYHEGQFPVAEEIGRRTITLPLHAGMHDDDVLRVCEAVQRVTKASLR
ncbi:MAG: DegT/DnrJ/EryC1/StrS aminotransferase family protein [Burkholderiaceae bacterium]|nr:DegT/DnrJ/EryC1/StrS aminotransferase family protein [Burkholderiaceae bacterium]